MTDTPMDIKSTVQGVDPSVLVDEGMGEQVSLDGQPATAMPLSAGNQAEVERTTTGQERTYWNPEVESGIFLGRHSLSRTPPSIIKSEGNLRDIEVEQATKKRKISGSPVVIRVKERTLTGAMIQLQKKVSELKTFVKENRNVHKDIKLMTQQIAGLTEKVATEQAEATDQDAELGAMQLNRRYEEEIKKLKETVSQKEEEMRQLEKRSKTINAATQCDGLEEKIERRTNEVIERIKENMTYKEYKEAAGEH